MKAISAMAVLVITATSLVLGQSKAKNPTDRAATRKKQSGNFIAS